jgi:putative hemolysin
VTAFLLLSLLLFLNAVFSGSETGIYTLSRIRLDAEAREGRRAARILRRILRSEAGFLIALLAANNLMLELATHLARSRVEEWSFLPPGTRELFVTILLTPLVFVFGELLPKDLFRRRPHRLLPLSLPILLLARVLLWPVTLPLRGLSVLLERALGIHGGDLARALGREELLDVLRQGAREGALAPHAEGIARRVLSLRETPIEAVMVPWVKVETVDLDAAPGPVRERIGSSEYTRLPALGRVSSVEEGVSSAKEGEKGAAARVLGYIHQLDVLASPAGSEPRSRLRPLTVLAPSTPVDQVLNRMRIGGRRMALVGSLEDPRGLVCLADLIAVFAGSTVDEIGGRGKQEK